MDARELLQACLREAGPDTEAGLIACEYILANAPVTAAAMSITDDKGNLHDDRGRFVAREAYEASEMAHDATEELKPGGVSFHKKALSFADFALQGTPEEATERHTRSEIWHRHAAKYHEKRKKLFKIVQGDKDFLHDPSDDELIAKHTQAEKLHLHAAKLHRAARDTTRITFSHDIHNKQAQGVLDRAMRAARKMGDDARRDLDAALRSHARGDGGPLLRLIDDYKRRLTDILTTTQLDALLEGAREVADRVPKLAEDAEAVQKLVGDIPLPTFPNGPTLSHDTSEQPRDNKGRFTKREALKLSEEAHEATRDTDHDDPLEASKKALKHARSHKPTSMFDAMKWHMAAARLHRSVKHFHDPNDDDLIEAHERAAKLHQQAAAAHGDLGYLSISLSSEAAQSLASRNVLTRAEYDALDAAARAKAFTVANVSAQETLEKILDVLAENVREGADYETFRAAVLDAVESGTFMSEGHLETVFRTNVQTAFSDGQMNVLQHPVVRDQFPYSAYDAIHDDRARENHLALEKLGIGGTNIYRNDDPVFQTFRPPWDYCIPAESLIITSKGRVPIINVCIGDEVLTHRGRFRRVVDAHRTESVPELVSVELESGSFARATGEHRVLTQRGWVESSSLNVSDEVYQITDTSLPDLVVLKVNDGLQAEDFTNGRVSIFVGVSAILLDLRTDPGIGEVEVKPEWEGLLVERKVDPAFNKCGGKCLLVSTHSNNAVNMSLGIGPDSFPPCGNHLRSYLGATRGANLPVDLPDLFASLGMVAVVDRVRFGSRPQHDAPMFEKPPHRFVGYPCNAAHVRDTGLLVDVVGDESFDPAGPQAKTLLGVLLVGGRTLWLFPHSYNCSIGRSRVKTISRVNWRKPVYNIAVEDDHSYVADGVVMHNCDRCSWTPITIRQAAERGVPEAVEWHRTGVPPTEPARVAMPTFRPPPGFDRSLAGTPLSVQMSLQPMATFSITTDGGKPEEETDASLLLGEVGATTTAALDTAQEGKAHDARRPNKHIKVKKGKRTLHKRMRIKRRWSPSVPLSTDAAPSPPAPAAPVQPDDVAAWYAELFDLLRRAGAPPTRAMVDLAEEEADKGSTDEESVALGMVGDEWHGPTPPSKRWEEIAPGPRGGKRWRMRGMQPGGKLPSKRAEHLPKRGSGKAQIAARVEAGHRVDPAAFAKHLDQHVARYGGKVVLNRQQRGQANRLRGMLERHHGPEGALLRAQELSLAVRKALVAASRNLKGGKNRNRKEYVVSALRVKLAQLKEAFGGRTPDGVGADGTGNAVPAGPAPDIKIVTARPEQHANAPATAPGVVPESLARHLSPHQQEGVARAITAIDRDGGFLCADGTGVGKTRQILATAKVFADRGKKVVIVSPAGIIKPDWTKNEISGSVGKDGQAMGVPLQLSRGDEPLVPGQVAVTTYEMLTRMKEQVDGDTIILFDEAHGLKNETSIRSRQGMECATKAGGVYYATATPADHPLDLAYLFRAKVFGDKSFADVRRDLNPDRVGPEVAYKNTADLFDVLTAKGLMVKREISLDGVEAHFDTVALPPEGKQALEAIAGTAVSAKDKAQVLMKQRFEQEKHKIPTAAAQTVKELAEGRQVVLFVAGVGSGADTSEVGPDGKPVASLGTARQLKAALVAAGVPLDQIGELHGAEGGGGKEEVAGFQAGQRRVLITTAQSGGTGHNLDDVVGNRPRTQIIMTAPFSAIDNAQIWGRTHRLTTRSKSRIRYMFADTDVDRWNAGLIRGKVAALGAIVAGEAERQNVPGMVAGGVAASHDVSEEARDEKGKWKKDPARLAASFIHRWSWKGVKSLPSIEAEKLLKQSRPTSPITLYRFERKDHDPSKSQMGQHVPLQAWMKSRSAAHGIAEAMNNEGNGEYIVKERTFKSHEVYADFTNMPEEVKKHLSDLGGDSGMDEVLVYNY